VLGWSSAQSYGALAALAGDRLPADCTAGAVSALPTAFVGVAGPYDPSFLSGDPRPDLVRTDPARCQALNPYTHICGNPDLRVSLLHGADDPAVPPEMSIAFGDALVAAGYDVALTLIEEYGHEVPTPGSGAFDAIVEETAGVACARGLANGCR